MEKLKLIKPTIEYKDQALEYVQEFEDNNSNIYGIS
jgi:predicted acetyltransferase